MSSEDLSLLKLSI